MVKKRDVGAQFIAPLLQIDGITFGYDRQPLLYDIHVQVDEGEMVGLLGPDGSGKTTPLRLIGGVWRQRHAKFLLQGRTLRLWGDRALPWRLVAVPRKF